MSGLKPIAAFLLILSLAGLACSFPDRNPAAQAAPTPAVTLDVSTEAQAFEDQLATAAAEFSNSGTLSLTLTETQMTAYFTQKIAAQPDIPLSEPRVSLRDGQITLTGKVKVSLATVDASMVFAPAIENGAFQVTTVSANFGSMPVPDSMLNQINDLVNQNLNELTSVDGRPIQIEQVGIADGTMTISGKAR